MNTIYTEKTESANDPASVQDTVFSKEDKKYMKVCIIKKTNIIME